MAPCPVLVSPSIQQQSARLQDGRVEKQTQELCNRSSWPSPCWPPTPRASVLLTHGREKLPSLVLNYRWHQFHRGPREGSAATQPEARESRGILSFRTSSPWRYLICSSEACGTLLRVNSRTFSKSPAPAAAVNSCISSGERLGMKANRTSSRSMDERRAAVSSKHWR